MSVGMGGGVGDRNVTRNMSNKRKPKNVKRTLSRMFAYLKPHKVKLILVVVFILFSALANVVGASFISTLIDKYILPMTKIENPNFAPLIGALALMAGFYLTGAAATYIYNRIMVDITNISLQKIRNELFEHMQKLPIKYYDTHTHGELMSRYTNDIDAMRQMLSQGFPQLLSSSITVVGVFVAMLLQSPLLMVLVIVMLFVMLKTVSILKKKSGKHFINMQTSLGKVNGKVEEMISGQKVVKVFCHEKEAVKDFDVLNDELAATGTSAHSYSNVLMPIMGNLSYLHYALTAMSGGLMLAFSITNLTVGKLGSFLQLTRQFSQPITQLSQLFMAVMTALAGAERVFEMLDENQEIDEGNITLVNVTMDNNGILAQSKERTGIWAWKIPDIGDYNNNANNDNCNIDNHNNDNNYKFTLLKGDVRFSDVTFSYEKEKAVLKNLSLYAKPGQKIAFVGSTGAGKTTITNLINRFYDVDNGAITYDGIDVRRIKKDDLRRSLAIVLQDTHLFTGTVAQNIKYGNINATIDDIIAAAKIANANSFIELLPNGYDTMLTADGSNLSQGQRQLISIARAAIANPPVLILDEATSSIDTRTELHIEQGMDRLMQNRTVFVIAHRLSTVRNSDAITVLENGKIIERGDHENLIAQQGKYFQLYTGMFELT